MEEIRQLNAEEMPLSSELIDFAFKREGSPDTPLVICRPEDTWGCFIYGQLASNIVIITLQVFVHGQVHDMGLIAGVASYPEFRKSGTIRKLLIHGLKTMREQGQTISYLGPFSYPFYRKFGWEMMYDYKSYTLKASSVPDWRGAGRVRRITPDIPRLNRIYEQYAGNFNGMLKRGEDRWKYSILKNKKGFIAVYGDEAGDDRGYMIYQYVGSQLTIHELVYLDRDAYRGLWEFIRKQDSMYESVAFRAPADDPFPFLIDDPKGLETGLVNHLMVRIVDVCRFIEGYRFSVGFGGVKIILNITDEHAPWNNGTFEIAVENDGSARTRKVDGAELPENAPTLRLSCDIQTLSTMMIGYKRPKFLYELERLRGSAPSVSVLESIIPENTPYYIDFGY